MAKKKAKPKPKPKRPPAKLGRPTLCTPELTEQFFKLRAAGNHIITCCQALGIHHDSWKEWHTRAREDKEAGRESVYTAFSARMTHAWGLHKATLLEQIKKAGTSGERPDWRALAWVLERTAPDEFADKTKMNVVHTGSVEQQHKGITIVLPPAIALPRPVKQITAIPEKTEPPPTQEKP